LKLDPNLIGLKGSPTQVRRIFAPQRDKGEIVDGDGEKMGHAVDAVFKKLLDWDFISLEK
jgi:electron transfer flavoprotein beta subunit